MRNKLWIVPLALSFVVGGVVMPYAVKAASIDFSDPKVSDLKTDITLRMQGYMTGFKLSKAEAINDVISPGTGGNSVIKCVGSLFSKQDARPCALSAVKSPVRKFQDLISKDQDTKDREMRRYLNAWL